MWFILDTIKRVHLVSEECKENGGVRGDAKDGNAAVENHKNILMDQGKPEKYTNMQKEIRKYEKTTFRKTMESLQFD